MKIEQSNTKHHRKRQTSNIILFYFYTYVYVMFDWDEQRMNSTATVSMILSTTNSCDHDDLWLLIMIIYAIIFRGLHPASASKDNFRDTSDNGSLTPRYSRPHFSEPRQVSIVLVADGIIIPGPWCLATCRDTWHVTGTRHVAWQQECRQTWRGHGLGCHTSASQILSPYLMTGFMVAFNNSWYFW